MHCREGREEGGGEGGGGRGVREETGQTSKLPLSQKRPESMLGDEGDTIKSLCVCPLVKKNRLMTSNVIFLIKQAR